MVTKSKQVKQTYFCGCQVKIGHVFRCSFTPLNHTRKITVSFITFVVHSSITGTRSKTNFCHSFVSCALNVFIVDICSLRFTSSEAKIIHNVNGFHLFFFYFFFLIFANCKMRVYLRTCFKLLHQGGAQSSIKFISQNTDVFEEASV